jgi:hypothetical protein
MKKKPWRYCYRITGTHGISVVGYADSLDAAIKRAKKTGQPCNIRANHGGEVVLTISP